MNQLPIRSALNGWLAQNRAHILPKKLGTHQIEPHVILKHTERRRSIMALFRDDRIYLEKARKESNLSSGKLILEITAKERSHERR